MSDITDPSVVHIKAAQYFVRKKLEELKSTKRKFTFKAPSDEGLASKPFSWNKLCDEPELGQPALGARVAIIGAGVAGLRTAMLLEKLNIPYRIFEANDGPGGRLFTYRFPSDPTKSPPGKHDYYEVGGMRFPDNTANQPTFDLFRELGFRFRNAQNPDGELIPFVYGLDDNVRRFNNITTTAKEVANGVNLFNEGEPDGNVPRGFTDMQDVDKQGNVYRGVDACFFKAFNDLRAKLLANFDEEWPKLLEEWDWASTRSYLARADELKFPPPVIDWIEKHKSGTGRYARVKSTFQEVLESITFDHPKSEQLNWWCIEGGSEGLITKMLSKLASPPSYNHRVTAIAEENSLDPLKRVKVSILDKDDDYFSHVVSTVTFAVLRTINTDGVHMNFNQREAMRALNYGQSIKVGIKFKTRWWEHIAKAPQPGGASRTDRQSRVVVYPSYGLNETGPGVLMVSYNWDQDAARFGALIKNTQSYSEQPKPDRPRSPSEKVLLDQIYQDLAVLHTPNNSEPGVVEKFKRTLINDTLDFHAFDWYHNPFTMGAFAQFTPGQFSTLYADILQPAGRHGNFHFAGELASHHHAWVAGALDSATRVVGHIEKSQRTDKGLFEFSPTLPRSLVFDSDETADNFHLWGLVKEA